MPKFNTEELQSQGLMSSKAWKGYWSLLYQLLGITKTQIQQGFVLLSTELPMVPPWSLGTMQESGGSHVEGRRECGLHNDTEIVWHINRELVSRKNGVKPIYIIFGFG